MPQIAGFRGAIAGGARDAGRAVYRYHQLFAGPGGRQLVRKMVVCAVRLAPWQDAEVRPHELVEPAARDAELARIRETRAHAQPVLAGFRDPADETDRLFRKAESTAATHEVTTPDGTVHRLWRVNDAELLGKLRHLFAPKPLHVLDGHARYEAMLAYQGELAGKQALALYSAANYGLACLVELTDPALVVAARHRIIRGANVQSAAVLAAAREHFVVETLAGAAGDVAAQRAALAAMVAHQPAFVVVFAGEPDAHKLTLKPEVSPIAAGLNVHRAVQKSEPIVVDQLFVARHLAGGTVATEVDASAALAAKGDVALIMRPVSVEEIVRIADAGQHLPAGSTAFHPPLAPGLIAMPIEPDEDLV
jgi:uncharacterized protein (DUF1015 family)